MILLVWILLLCPSANAAEAPKCPASDSIDSSLFSSHFQDYLIGYDLLNGPGETNPWPLFQAPKRSARSNNSEGCRVGKLKDRHGILTDIRLPPFVDQLETYPQPTIIDAGLITYNSTWRAYIDWRRRRLGTVLTVANDTKYDELYAVLEYPFRPATAALPYKEEFNRLIQLENRFFRISTAAHSGTLTLRPRTIDHLHPRFVDYLKAALDGGDILQPVNRISAWRSDEYRYWNPDDEKAHNWFVIFSDAYGTHFPTSIKFGHIFDIWINRTSCQQQPESRLSELAQCYFAEAKLNLSVSSSLSTKDGLVSISNSPNSIQICPHLRQALRDLRASILHPSGHLEQLLLDSTHSMSDYLKRIDQEARRLWLPTIIEARMSPICELVPLVKPNDLDAKVACETNLVKYMRSIEPIDKRSPSIVCSKNERKLVTQDGAFCISTRFSEASCPSSANQAKIYVRTILLLTFILVWTTNY